MGRGVNHLKRSCPRDCLWWNIFLDNHINQWKLVSRMSYLNDNFKGALNTKDDHNGQTAKLIIALTDSCRFVSKNNLFPMAQKYLLSRLTKNSLGSLGSVFFKVSQSSL